MKTSRKLSRPLLAAALSVVVFAAAAGDGLAAKDPNLPASTAKPTITGLRVGQTLTATTGTWSSPTSLAFYYQWVRQAADGTATPIPGATAQTYTIGPADIGYHLFVQVKAENSTGPAWENSDTTSYVIGTALSGAVTLPSGEVSYAATSVSPPDRLLVQGISFSPNALRPGKSVTARFRILDENGNPVHGALVSAQGLPFGAVRAVPTQPTGLDGWATFQLVAGNLKSTGSAPIALYVHVRKPNGETLGGVSGSRLVKLPVAGS